MIFEKSELDDLDEEMEAIEREYRWKIACIILFGVIAFLWCVAKLWIVHLKIVG